MSPEALAPNPLGIPLALAALVAVLVTGSGVVSAAAAAAPTRAAGRSVAALTLPKTFSGSLTDVAVQSAWKGDSGDFSGYRATYAFSKLDFGPGSQGPYTLLHGQLVFSGFNEKQTAPAGNSGTCTATYHFTINHAQPFSGDLGGFSTANGVTHVDISLGVSLNGPVATSSNCGPGLEFTSHQFGEPPRMEVSIDATGRFNPATGAITVSSRTTTPVPGASSGTQVDTVSGTLRGAS